MEADEEMEDCEGMFSDDDDDGSQTDDEESEGTEGSSDGDDDDGDDDGGDDSEEEGDEEDGEGEAWETDEEDEDGLLEASDSDTEGDNCPICLNRFRDQDIGNPEACDHSFCLECIQEWAKNVNTCPVDRQVFHLILCRHSGEEKIFRRIPVEDRNKQAEEVEEDPTYCEVCNQCDREDRLLLCDGCDLGYHLDCLTPPLKRVPVDEWFCPECGDDLAEEVDDSEEMDEIIAENDAYIPRRNRRQPRRQIARTRVAERVRSAIEEIRVNRTRTIRRILSSSEDEEDSPPTNAASSSTSSTKKSTPKKRKATIRKTPRIYPKKKGTKRKTGKRKTVKRRKTTKKRRKTTRKGGRRKKRVKRARTARPVPVTTVKSRIAGALGLSTPPVGRTIPMQKLKQEKSMDMKKQDIGAVGLSIFGAREELMHFSDEDGTSMPNSVPRASRYSRSALSSYKPIGRVPIIPAKKAPKNFVVEAAPATSGGPLDLLGSIMMDQDKLIMGSRDITIQKDGSLATKGKETLKTLVKKATDKVIPPTGSASDTCLFKSTFSSIRSTSPSKSQHHNSSSPTKSTPVNIFENSVSPTKFSKKSQIQIQISPKKNVVTDKDSTTSSSLETSKSLGFKPSILSEAYDPAHPTDELEEGSVYTPILENPENMNPVSEDEYDPAHPTEDIEYDFDSSGNEEENGNDNDEKSVSDDEKDTNEDLSNISSDENSVVNKDDGEYDDISDESLDNDAEAQQDNSVNDMDIEYTEDADSIKVKEYVDPAVEGANCDDGSSEIGAEKHRAANNMNVPSDVGITESSEEQVSSVIAKGSENNSDHKYSDKESKLNNSANVAEKVETIKPVVPSRPGFHSGLPQVTGYKRSIPTALSQKDKGVDKLNSTGEKFPMKPPALKSLFEKPTNPVSQNSNPGGSKNTSATNKGNPTSKNPGNPHSKDNEKKSPTKKLLPTLKPFEITRKTQVEKRRLYGGEIDFTEDVTFSEGEFPDFDYSIKIKTIEEVFKDTKKKEVKKITKKIEPVPDEKLGEKFTPIDTEAREIQETVHADIDKIDLAKADTISVENIEPVVDSVENSQNVDTADSHSNNNEPLEDSDESNKFKLAMEHMKSTLSDKIQLVVDGAKSGKNKASKSDGIDSTKSTLSDRFKSVSEKNSSKKEIVSDKFRSISDVHEESFKSLEEEDPIHEMRRLDKQLEKELGNPDLVKKKSRSDKEYKHEKEKSKSKRKVSIDRDDVESSWRETKESRRMEAEYRSKTWEEIEEGEVEVEEIRYKEKKKKDRHKEKRKKADKEEKYYEYDDREDGEIQYVDPNKGKSDADLDTRIVIQVSQHNEDRQVWEEDEKLKKKMKKEREREERRKERERSRERESRREKKRKRRSRSRERHRSRERRRSRSRREREKSRSRSRDRSLERARRKKRRDRERDRSRSKSRDRSLERSRKKKRRNRDRSRDRSSSREQSVEKIDIFGRDIGLWSGRDKEKHSKREKSSEKSDIFGTATSRHSESPRRSKSKESEEDTHAPSSQSPVNHLKHEETSEFQITVPSKKQHGAGKKSSVSSKQTRVAKLKAEEVSRIEVKDYGHPGTKYSGSEAEERDDDYDDEPEETEQFSYTDRDDYLGQNRHKQQQENMIDVLKVRGEYDPAEPTEPSSPQPPQPPTPPLPLMAEQPFIRGPFPPPGPPPLHPPPPGPPPGIMQPPLPITIRESPPPSMLMGQERPPLPLCPDRPLIPMSQEGPPLPIPTCEPPGPGILGDRVLMHRPPPPREPPPGMMQSPNRLPMGMNVLPPAFPRGMSPQNHQRPMIIPPLMEQRPRLNMPRLGWQEVPFRGPAPPLVNGPFERLPLLSEEPRGSPLRPPFPPHPVQMNEPPRHLVQIRPDCPPPSNLVQIPRDEHPIVPPGPGPPPFPSPSPPARHLIQLPPHRGDARLPIPLLPTSEAPPHSVFLSMPPPTTVITSMVGRSPTPPGDAAMSGPPPFRPLLEQEFEAYPRTPSPHTPVMSVLPNLQNNIPVSPPIDSQAIPGLGDLNSIPTVTEVINSAMNGKSVSPDFEDKDRKSPVPALSQLEQITKLLTTQAKLIQEQDKNDSATKNDIHNKHLSDDKLFKVPLPPGSKSVFGIKAETTEVVDMDVSSPNDDEGTIELPLSPEFDNFIDFDLQEMFNKKTSEKKNDREKKLSKVTKTPEKSNVDTSALNDAALKKNEIDISIISKLLDTSIKNLKMKEEDEALKKEVESACKKTIVTSPLVKTEPDDSKAHVDIVTKVFGVSIPKENITITKTKDVKMKLKENKPHHHQKTKSHKRKEKDKSHHKEKDMSLKALRDAQLDLESRDMPSSAVDMENQEKYLKKLHLQERVVEEVKMAIKPHYANKDVTKDQYKDILRRAVPKICHSKSGDINPSKIKSLVEAYVGKFNKIQEHKDLKHSISPGLNNQISPGVKANGERVKSKAKR